MRILLTSSATSYGGAEHYLAVIARAAHAVGHEVHVALSAAPGMDALAADLGAAGMTLHRWKVGLGPGRAALPVRSMAVIRLLRRVRPDAAHLTLPWPDEGLPVMIACALCNVPLTTVFQLVAHLPSPGRLQRLYRWSRAHKQRWVAVSRHNRALLARGFGVPQSEIDVVYNGADVLHAEGDDIRKELRLPADTPLVLTIGRLDAQKGYDRIIASVRQITARVPNARFLWAGQGPERDGLEAAARRYDVSEHIIMLGQRTDVGRLLRDATVFLFPSRYEGCPFAIIEAMHAGSAIVAARSGGIPELIRHGEHGLLIDGTSPDGLAAAVTTLIGDRPFRERLGAAARERAAGFGRERMIAATLALLTGPPARPSPRRPHSGEEVVSVVLPTSNRASALKRAVVSAQNQTYPVSEIIVIDDGSRDDTPRLLAEMAAEDPRIRVITQAEAVGPARARNAGIGAARGDLIAFLDDDDEWLPHKIEVQYAALVGASADMVYSAYHHVDAAGRERVRGTVDAEGTAGVARLAQGNFIATPGVLLRADVLHAVGGFNESMSILEDWELWIRIAAAHVLAFVGEPLFRVHYSAGSVSSRSVARRSACERIAQCFCEIAPGDRRMLSDAFYSLGTELMQGGVPAEARAYMRRALRLRPWPPRRFVMAAAAHAGDGIYRRAADAHRRTVDLARGPA